MEEILKLIDSYWRFNNYQEPMSSWHDKQDLLDAVKEEFKKQECNHPYAFVTRMCDYEKCEKCGTVLCEG